MTTDTSCIQLELEQDKLGGDDLPTYDALAAQSGPNSRFGRWRGWIEKRAAERYVDISPEERLRRRARGWGDDDSDTPPDDQPLSSGSLPEIFNQPPTPTSEPPYSQQNQHLHQLHIQTSALPPVLSSTYLSSPSPPSPLPLLSQSLPPTHLKLNHFGSRFLPHTTSPIRCLLPLLSDRLLLIGHDDGLSVLNMLPQEWMESGGIMQQGPDEAKARLIWDGEGVYQMTILEVENTGEGSPQGVVLVLIGDSGHSKDQEPFRTLRMYNLASLTSLAKWAIAQKGTSPLDLRRPSNWTAQQTFIKKHRPQSSITRSLKSLIDSPGSSHFSHTAESSYQGLLSPSATNAPHNFVHGKPGGDGDANGKSNGPAPLIPLRAKSAISSDSTWDLIDDLPLRWATDFVPLASAGSKLVNTSVISYDLWREGGSGKGAMLAVATKANIILYEAPKGERAFRIVKEFYTPLTPRSITFVQQVVENVRRHSSNTNISSPSRYNTHQSHPSNLSIDSTHTANSESPLIRSPGRLSPAPPPASPTTTSYGTHLSIFVVFDKKAGWIRVADSAAGEIELCDGHTTTHIRDSLSSSPSIRRPRSSSDGGSQGKGSWIIPVRAELPVPPSHGYTPKSRTVHLLTRGKVTHIVPSPLPANVALHPPLHIVTWSFPPAHVAPRVRHPPADEGLPYLQLIALGEDGVEVQEISLDFLTKSKNRSKMEESRTAQADVGGATGFLCSGGHWDKPNYPYQSTYPLPLSRSYSTSSDMTLSSFDTEDLINQMRAEEGVYGWCRKGVEDWRVFWVGGSHGIIDDDHDSI